MATRLTVSPNVVIDSNVYISALVFGGTPRQILTMVSLKQIQPVMSEHIMGEVRRILAAKFPDFVVSGAMLEQLLKDQATWVPLSAAFIDVCRDDDDNRVLETAVIGKASALITGDKDLLVLKCYKQITIATPTSYWKMLDTI